MSATVLALYLGALWITLTFWTYRDIRQRTRDPIVQTVAVILVLILFLPGHWIYLILRPRYTLAELYERSLEEEALLQELEDQKACPTCKRRIQDDFLLCPSCRTHLKEPCRGCQKPLNYAWLACPYCGLEKPAREGVRPVPRQPARAGAVAPGPVRQAAPAPRPRDPGPPPPRPTQRPIAEDSGVIDATAE
jgi:RNA polymerase subunit RPABC4/transcription elongation factor Spt4